jgi:hypothetical protein
MEYGDQPLHGGMGLEACPQSNKHGKGVHSLPIQWKGLSLSVFDCFGSQEESPFVSCLQSGKGNETRRGVVRLDVSLLNTNLYGNQIV